MFLLVGNAGFISSTVGWGRRGDGLFWVLVMGFSVSCNNRDL